VRAVLLHQPDPPGGVAERDQVLAQQPDPGRRAARVGDLGGQAGRRPVPAQQLAHQRPGPDPGQDLVVFRLKHAGASDEKSAAIIPIHLLTKMIRDIQFNDRVE